jgi:alpha-beta hydrolase superfamily lysophospholipase
VDFHNDHRAPLLIIGGGMDHIVPGSVTREAADRFEQSASVTEYTEYAGRSHYTLGQPGWEEVADHGLTWAVEHGRSWLDARAA